MTPDHDVIIIGAGFGGLGLAIQLKKAGLTDFLILESQAGVGGTWWVNRYPGCACDVQSHLYSLSFAPNPHWSRHFPARAEIQAHLNKLVQTEGLQSHLRLNTRVECARWDDEHCIWVVTDQYGAVRTARLVVGATGGLSRPKWPTVPGMDNFQGEIFHSQNWPEELNLVNKRVAVIGTGASAVQFIPHVAREAKHLSIFQRTPNWILPKPDRPIAKPLRWLYEKIPPTRWVVRFALFCLLETRLPAFTRFPKLSAMHRRKALSHLKQQISDASLRQSLTPQYSMGCKRVLMSNDFYPTFNRSNVSLVTHGIERITPTGIIDAKETEHTMDVIVLGTGFEATQPIPEGLIVGRHGEDLAKQWHSGPEAYKGLSVHGFPNFFMILGPNTALGHNSVLLMIEGQIRYIMDAVGQLKQHGWRRLEVTHQSQRVWNERLAKTLGQSVWNAGGCDSWYLHPISQRNTTLWPHTTIYYKRLTKRFDVANYACD